MPYCYDHDRGFRTQEDFEKHMLNAASHNWCQRCNEDFPTRRDLRNHKDESNKHHICPWCKFDFPRARDLTEHFRIYHDQCESCDLWCEDEGDLKQHKHDAHWYCEPCNRIFQNNNNLQAHLNSSVHKPKNFECPFCPRKQVSPSAVVAHLESGNCKSGITRAMIDNYIAKWDRNRIVTTKPKMITDGNGQSALAPSSTYQATQRSWNGSAYECPMCDREFLYLAQLNQHLASPKHSKRDDKLYQCKHAACQVKFETFSGLIQHFETGSCGVRNQKPVKDALEGLQLGFSQFRIGY